MVWISATFAALSLLALFRAPAKPFWFVAIAATEWGHWLAIFSLFLFFLSWRSGHRWSLASWLILLAAFVYVTPLVRSFGVARQLPGDLVARFGPVDPRGADRAPARSRPLDLGDLFKGIASPPVQVTSLVYATVGVEALSMDLYRPKRVNRPLPGVLVVHGGSWQSGDRKEFQDLSRYLAARGYWVAAVDYRLAPASIFPAQRDDVFSAVAYLKSHAKDLGLDKDRLVLLGRSAGGQIALSAAYAGRDPAIKGVVVFYTPNDLCWAYSIPANPLIMNSQKVIETYLGGRPDQVPAAYAAASPLLRVNEKTPPTLMIHGGRDELVWALHDERLSERLAQAHRPFFYLCLPWATHGCDANFSGPSGQLSTYAIERFLAAVLPA